MRHIVSRLAITATMLMVTFSGAQAMTDDFILSYWLGPPVTLDQDAAYNEVKALGFNYALPAMGGGSKENNLKVLNACQKYGLKYILEDPRILAKDPSDPNFKANLDAVVADYKSHPALGGYYIVDEPSSPAFDKLAAIYRHLKEADPERIPYINLLPTYATPGQLGNPTYQQHVRMYLDKVKPDLLSYDHYALLSDNTTRGDYFQNMEIIRNEALKDGIRWNYIFLLMEHGPYRKPNDEDLRWQVGTALAYGATSLMYFTYWVPSPDPNWNWKFAIFDENGKPSEHHSRVMRINREITTIAPTLMKLKSTAVYHTKPLPDGTTEQPASAPLLITSTSPAVIGHFVHADGSKWAIVVNRDLVKGQTMEIKLGDGYTGLEEMIVLNGVLRKVPVNQGSARLALRAGQYRLLKLSK